MKLWVWRSLAGQWQHCPGRIRHVCVGVCGGLATVCFKSTKGNSFLLPDVSPEEVKTSVGCCQEISSSKGQSLNFYVVNIAMSISEKPWEIMFAMGICFWAKGMHILCIGRPWAMSSGCSMLTTSKGWILVLQKLWLCLYLLSKCKSLSANLYDNVLTRVAGDRE